MNDAHQSVVKVRLRQILLKQAPEPVRCECGERPPVGCEHSKRPAAEAVDDGGDIERQGQGQRDAGAGRQRAPRQAKLMRCVAMREVAGQYDGQQRNPGTRVTELPAPNVE